MAPHPGDRQSHPDGSEIARADFRPGETRAHARRPLVYIGAERVDDVTRHPAFRQGAQTIASLYELKADPAQRDLFSYEEDGERFSLYWLAAAPATISPAACAP